MVLSSHFLDGIGKFKQDTLPADIFEEELDYCGYKFVAERPVDYKGRYLYLYQHEEHRDIHAIYSKDRSVVITAFHP
jgi:hypothetical protein